MKSAHKGCRVALNLDPGLGSRATAYQHARGLGFGVPPPAVRNKLRVQKGLMMGFFCARALSLFVLHIRVCSGMWVWTNDGEGTLNAEFTALMAEAGHLLLKHPGTEVFSSKSWPESRFFVLNQQISCCFILHSPSGVGNNSWCEASS